MPQQRYFIYKLIDKDLVYSVSRYFGYIRMYLNVNDMYITIYV